MGSPLLWAILTLSAPLQRWEERSFERTTNAASLRELIGEIPLGNVKVRPSAASVVRIHVLQKIKSNSADFNKWWLGGSALDAKATDGKFEFKFRLPKDQRSHNSLSVDMNIEVDIQVPARMSCNLTSGAGNVDASRLSGALHIHTGAGNVALRDLDSAANVQVNSGAGNISVSGRVGNINLQSGAGNVDLRDVRLEGRDVDVQVGAGNIEVSILRAPSNKLTLNSGVGNVKLHLARGIATNIVRDDTKRHGPGPEGGTVTGTVGAGKLRLSSGIGQITVNGK